MKSRMLVFMLCSLVIAIIWGCSDEQVTGPQQPTNTVEQAKQPAAEGDVVTLDDLKSMPDTGTLVTTADVAITEFTGTTVVMPGDMLVLNATVANVGDRMANGPFDVWIGVLNTGFELGRLTLAHLEVGGARSGTVEFQVPVAKLAQAYPPGTYTLYCTHDFADANPANNYQLLDVELHPVVQTGDIVIDVTPDETGASWQLTGPDGFYQYGTGDHQFFGLPVGTYTVNWGFVPGWVTPEPVSHELISGEIFTFTGLYEPGGVFSDYLTMYFDDEAPCTSGAFLDHVAAYIVYMNPTLDRVRGIECGFDITSPTKDSNFNTSVSVSYPAQATDVGVSDAAAGTYNYITGYATPLDVTGSSFVFATLDIFVLDAGELDFTLRGSIPSSDTENGMPMVMLDDFSLMSLQLGMQPGSPTMVLNPTGDCPVVPVE